jgi:hypothetical protein
LKGNKEELMTNLLDGCERGFKDEEKRWLGCDTKENGALN